MVTAVFRSSQAGGQEVAPRQEILIHRLGRRKRNSFRHWDFTLLIVYGCQTMDDCGEFAHCREGHAHVRCYRSWGIVRLQLMPKIISVQKVVTWNRERRW